jgi:hypothetical protein
METRKSWIWEKTSCNKGTDSELPWLDCGERGGQWMEVGEETEANI